MSNAKSTENIKRFWESVRVGKPDECWEWQGGTCTAGSGVFSAGGRRFSANRYAYWIGNKRKPQTGKQLSSSCDNKLCVNPDHLFLRTIDEEFVRSRFMESVTKMPDGCWKWEGTIKGGFPTFSCGRKVRSAARVAKALAGEKIAEDRVLKRTCENKACVSPEHYTLCSNALREIEMSGDDSVEAQTDDVPTELMTAEAEKYAKLFGRYSELKTDFDRLSADHTKLSGKFVELDRKNAQLERQLAEAVAAHLHSNASGSPERWTIPAHIQEWWSTVGHLITAKAVAEKRVAEENKLREQAMDVMSKLSEDEWRLLASAVKGGLIVPPSSITSGIK